MTTHRHDNPCSLAWRNRVANGVVVRPVFMGLVAPVAAAITRQASGDKPGPSGFEPRRSAP